MSAQAALLWNHLHARPAGDEASPLQAVLFDVDGVLVDACELHFEALNQALRTLGYMPITPGRHENVFNGLPTKVKLQMLTEMGELPAEAHARIAELKQEFTEKGLERLPVHLGTVELLKQLWNDGIGIAACSNALHRSVVLMLRSTGLRPYVHAVVGNDDVENPKPAPDVYFKGAQLLGVPIGECAIVEDSDVGVQAAAAAAPGRFVHVTGPEAVNPTLLPRLLERRGLR